MNYKYILDQYYSLHTVSLSKLKEADEFNRYVLFVLSEPPEFRKKHSETLKIIFKEFSSSKISFDSFWKELLKMEAAELEEREIFKSKLSVLDNPVDLVEHLLNFSFQDLKTFVYRKFLPSSKLKYVELVENAEVYFDKYGMPSVISDLNIKNVGMQKLLSAGYFLLKNKSKLTLHKSITSDKLFCLWLLLVLSDKDDPVRTYITRRSNIENYRSFRNFVKSKGGVSWTYKYINGELSFAKLSKG